MTTRAICASLATVAAFATLASLTAPAIAGELTKEGCVDAHSRGQDAREQGQLSLARKLFLSCAQAACPSLLQGDCARFADDLGRLQPSVTFVARDGSGADLPDTTVYVDDALLLTRLDGTLHDLDPGKHVVKFSNGGHDEVVTLVIGNGEKGRIVSARFGAVPVASAVTPNQAAGVAVVASPPSRPRPLPAKLMLVGGSAMLLGGTALAIIELGKIPSGCSVSTHQCAAPPGDPVFAQASDAVGLSNVGWVVAGVGAAVAVGGIIWYVTSPTSAKEQRDQRAIAVAPWMTATSGGFAVSGAL